MNSKQPIHPTHILPVLLALLLALPLPALAKRKPKPAPGAVSVAIAPERRVLAADRPEAALVKIGLTGAALPSGERPAVNLALVLDRSASMHGDRIARAREAAIAAVERLDSRDYVSVVVFDDRIDVLAGAQTASPANKSAIVEKLRTVEARGTTAIFGGVSAGAAELRKNLSRNLVNRLILLSDGQANVGPSSPEELGHLGASLVKETITASTMGVGLGYNENLMAALAGRSDGNTYFIENSDDLPRIFNAELGDAFQVAARDVRLSVRFDGAHPVELVGRDGRIEDGTVTVDFNQIYSTQEKYVLVRTEFPIGRDGETRPFATAEVAWTAPGTGESGSASASASISFSADERAVRDSADIHVMVQGQRTVNAVRAQEALALNASGDFAGARRKMAQNREEMRQLRVGFDDRLLDAPEAAEALAEEESWNASAENALGGSLAPKASKALNTRSFQTQYQQTTPQDGF